MSLSLSFLVIFLLYFTQAKDTTGLVRMWPIFENNDGRNIYLIHTMYRNDQPVNGRVLYYLFEMDAELFCTPEAHFMAYFHVSDTYVVTSSIREQLADVVKSQAVVKEWGSPFTMLMHMPLGTYTVEESGKEEWVLVKQSQDAVVRRMASFG